MSLYADTGSAMTRSTSHGVVALKWATSQVLRARRSDRCVASRAELGWPDLTDDPARNPDDEPNP